MRRNKRVVESLAVLGLAGALTITAIPYSNVGVKEVESGFETNGIAGVTSALNNVQMDAYEEVGEVVTVTKVEVEMVASAKETTPVEPELSPEEQEWQDKLMTNIEDSLNVRENADVAIYFCYHVCLSMSVISLDGLDISSTQFQFVGYACTFYFRFGRTSFALRKLCGT